MDNESNIQVVRQDDWRLTYEQSLSRLQHWTSHIKQFPISVIEALRVNQLDAIMLDNEISVLLRMQYLKAFDLFRVSISFSIITIIFKPI
jgi:hypothetical protein